MNRSLTDRGGAGLLWPTVAALLALVILIGLGTWQLQRRAWKEGLLAAIAARTTAPPVSLSEALRRRAAGEDLEYLRVRLTGRFRHDHEQHYYAPGPGGPGFHIYTPLETTAGPIVLVNRGFVPEHLKDRATRADGLPAGQVEVVGLVRAPGEPGLFTPDNDPAGNLWFWRDLQGMAEAALGSDAPRAVSFFVDAEAQEGSAWPRGGTTRLDLPNRHLEYAFTWYGLALALIAVYMAFAASRMRPPRQVP